MSMSTTTFVFYGFELLNIDEEVLEYLPFDTYDKKPVCIMTGDLCLGQNIRHFLGIMIETVDDSSAISLELDHSKFSEWNTKLIETANKHNLPVTKIGWWVGSCFG